MEKTERLTVSLLGGFSMGRPSDDGQKLLTEQGSNSRRLLTFLQYLAVFHQRAVSQEELIEALWSDSDECANPVNTLKTLLYRARIAMEELGFSSGKTVIQYRRGVYTWGNEVALELDTEQFDALCSRAASSSDPEQALDLATQAIELYRGDFIPNAAGSPWAVSLRTYYHDKYLKLCNTTAHALFQAGRYNEAIHICRQVTTVGPYDERGHLMLMKTLAASGGQQAAMLHYNYVTNMFMDQFGVSPSEEMTALYRELSKSDMCVDMDLYTVRDLLPETEPPMGAFFCEYITFQDIYRLEARRALRSGQVVQLAMLTILDLNEKPLDAKRVSTAVEEMRRVIQLCLRQGDVFTRYSAAQYLLFLPTASYENGIQVIQRILDRYERSLAGRTTKVRYSLLPVLPSVGVEAL